MAINERLIYVDVQGALGCKLRILSAYFPDSSYGDGHVEALYNSIEAVIDNARKSKLKTILGADFNAQVGSWADGSGLSSLGRHGMGIQSSRGQWLASWADAQNLKIVNTFFRKLDDKLYTYTSTQGIEKQLDYILVDKSIFGKVFDVDAGNLLDLGSDHRSLICRSRSRPSQRKRKRQKRETTQPVPTWPPDDCDQYAKCLSETLDASRDSDLGKRCAKIEQAVGAAMRSTKSNDGLTDRQMQDDKEALQAASKVKLQSLFEERRRLDNKDRAGRAQISKVIRKEIKVEKSKRCAEQIETILHKFANFRSISGIKSRRKRLHIAQMEDAGGNTVTSKQDIADVFADFYADLYNSTHDPDMEKSKLEPRINQFSMGELEAALKKIKSGKAKDLKGIVAEMLKHGGDCLNMAILDLFNDAIRPEAEHPQDWKTTCIRVLLKSGAPSLAKNYRPISVSPIMYKLFSILVSSRIEGVLESKQSEDQAGFRKSYCMLDHIYALVLIQEKAEEWRHECWIAAVDFMKAFDSVEHESIWIALREQGVGEEYVALLRALYKGQKGVVATTLRSKEFDIKRGTKQGDPLSTLLFNVVLEQVFTKLKLEWARRGCGLEVSLGAKRHLSNLRFADDVLLFASTQKQLVTMLTELKEEASSCGLKLHPDKTKILSNAPVVIGRETPNHAKLGDEDVEILGAEVGTKYLGRKVCFKDFHEVELGSRITAAWRCFHKHKQELTSRQYPLRSRLRLFESTVTSTVLYGCEAWTLKDAMMRRLRAVQRKMLRMVLGSRRRLTRIDSAAASSSDSLVSEDDEKVDEGSEYELEPWSDFLKRVTHVAEER